MSLAAVAVGADGLMLEVHHKPEEALSDKEQALTPKQFEKIAKDVKKIRIFMEGLK
jgi:3-deoxy-7-phosphoheptulonate synthase